MLFNSLEFAVFLPVVFILYWFVFNRKVSLQNGFILVISYFFYGSWDWRFLFLIGTSTLIDYGVALALVRYNESAKRKWLLALSLFVNLGLLGVYKYYNFFIESFTEAFTLFGFYLDPERLNLILPVGISFYTFQTLSYTIDVYKRRIKPTKNIIAFAAFVSFFPQLVAGPIERAKNFLPQFFGARNFIYSDAVRGMQQILWGLVKKVVIADNCAQYVNYIHANSDSLPGSALFLGAVLFVFQLYGDFSGYSDISIGVARLFGFKLSQNFNYPLFATNFRQFWLKWHISLTTWFRDYVFAPLGGLYKGKVVTARNVLIVFGVSGLWHGAGWDFIIWGLLNGTLLLIEFKWFRKKARERKRKKDGSGLSINKTVSIIIVFVVTAILGVLFRAENLSHALSYYGTLFSSSIISGPRIPGISGVINTLIMIIVFQVIEWFGRNKQFAIEYILEDRTLPRWVTYITLVFIIIYFGSFDQIDFIYFQF